MTFAQRSVRFAALLLGLSACSNGGGTADENQRGASAASNESAEEGADEGSEEPGEDAADDDDEAQDDASEDQGDGAPPDEPGDAAVESIELPATCKLPFEPGACFAAFQVYAYDAAKGACVKQIWGGCGGNENRFETLALCEHTCGGGSTGPIQCPPNTKRAEVCLACGPAGGCAKTEVTCALSCDEHNDCKGGNEQPTGCVGGVCQVYGCI